MRVFLFSIVTFTLIYTNVQGLPPIANVINDYFHKDEHVAARAIWHKYQRGFEISISKAIKDGNNGQVMNVYMSKPRELYNLAKGCYVHDGNVDLVLTQLWLRRMPQILLPEVILGLVNNVMYIEAMVDKIFIDSSYWLLRNRSAVVYGTNPDDKNNSPFSLQQVTENGDVTLVGENCMLSGSIVLLLSGPSVALGHDTLKLSDCKFSVEISTPGLGAPPVLAPYLDSFKAYELMKILRRAMRQDLRPKIEGILLSYVNISAIFGTSASKKRRAEHKILFRNVWEYHNRVSYYFNKICSEDCRNGQDRFPDFKILVEDEIGSPYTVEINNIKVDGINTMYNSHDGGPYKLKHIYVSETFRFGLITVRADMIVEKTGHSHAVTAYIKDVGIDVTWKVSEENGTALKDLIDILPMNHRRTDFAIADMDLTEKERIKIEALLTGYLGEQLTAAVKNHLHHHLQEAFTKADLEREGPKPVTQAPQNATGDCDARWHQLEEQKKRGEKTQTQNPETYKVSPELENIKKASDNMKDKKTLRGVDEIKNSMHKLFNKVLKKKQKSS